MFRREPVADRERARASGAACFRDHSAMAEDGAGAIATAVEKHQDAGGVAARRD